MVLRELALGSDGDLRLTNGAAVIISGAEAVAQRLQVRLRTLATEWVFDQNVGTAWIGPIIGSKPNLKLVRSILTDRVLGTEGVARLLSLDLSLDRETRILTVNGRVEPETDDDAITFSADLEVF